MHYTQEECLPGNPSERVENAHPLNNFSPYKADRNSSHMLALISVSDKYKL